MTSDGNTKLPPETGAASPAEEPAGKEVPTSIRPSKRELEAVDFVVSLLKLDSRTAALRDHSINDCLAIQINAHQLTGAA